jgi:hypothetical protein
MSVLLGGGPHSGVGSGGQSSLADNAGAENAESPPTAAVDFWMNDRRLPNGVTPMRSAWLAETRQSKRTVIDGRPDMIQPTSQLRTSKDTDKFLWGFQSLRPDEDNFAKPINFSM